MLQFSSARLTQLQTDGLVVDVDCVAGEPSEALRRCCEVYPDVRQSYDDLFHGGHLRPGQTFVLPPSELRPVSVVLATTRVHPRGELVREEMRATAGKIVETVLRGGFRSVALLPFTQGRGLAATEIRRELLYSFARTPGLDLVFWNAAENGGPSDRVSIFTDGGVDPKSGRGGYGIVLRLGDHCREISAGVDDTTVERMELTAVVVALETLTRKCRVQIHTDSRYVVDTVNNGLLFRRAATGWKKKKLVAVDLWKRFLNQYLRHDVELQWVKGHSGIGDNHRCDRLAAEALQTAGDDDESDQAGPESAANRSPGGSMPARETGLSDVSAQERSLQGAENETAATQPFVKRNRDPLPRPIGSTAAGNPRRKGDPCRYCDHPLEQRVAVAANSSNIDGQSFLFCTRCKRFYHPVAALQASGGRVSAAK